MNLNRRNFVRLASREVGVVIRRGTTGAMVLLRRNPFSCARRESD